MPKWWYDIFAKSTKKKKKTVQLNKTWSFTTFFVVFIQNFNYFYMNLWNPQINLTNAKFFCLSCFLHIFSFFETRKSHFFLQTYSCFCYNANKLKHANIASHVCIVLLPLFVFISCCCYCFFFVDSFILIFFFQVLHTTWWINLNWNNRIVYGKTLASWKAPNKKV